MKILVARHAGFCFGVERAVQAVNNNLAEPLTTFGPIIHNPQVVSELQQKGVRVFTDPALAPTKRVVIRSHGAAKEDIAFLQAQGHEIVDATCPNVARIHRLAEEAAARGETLLVFGEKGHPEVTGILSRAGEAFILEGPEGVEALPQKRYVLVSQTTADEKKWNEIVALIGEKGYNVSVFHTICSATAQRQQEAAELAARCNCMLVVGGRESSNTRKLAALCEAAGAVTYLVESALELRGLAFSQDWVVGITAGASTPCRVIKEVTDYMNDQNKTVGDSDFIQEMNKSLVRIAPGQQVKGTVIYVNDTEAGVSIGFKSDGFVSKDELTIEGNVSPKDILKEGDVIDVEVLKVNDGNGNVILSRKAIAKRLQNDAVLSQINNKEPFEVTIKQAVKSGLLADYQDITVFIPASQIRERGYARELEPFVGQTFRVVALEVDTKKRRVVASRKELLVSERSQKEESFWGNIHEGDVVRGIVRRITDFGAFVDIGGYDGLLHIGDIAWFRLAKVTDVLAIGDELDVCVLSLNREKGQISLGYKQLQPKPWEYAPEKYPVGAIVTGVVARIAPFGAFITLEPGIEGMVHISEVANGYVKKVEDVLSAGQTVEAVVLDVNAQQKRISLSIKGLIPFEDGQDALADIPEEE